MRRLARWCIDYRRSVLILWLAALIGFFAIDRSTGNAFNDRFQLHGTQSADALSLLQSEFPAASGSSDQIVVHARSGVGSLIAQDLVQEMLDRVATLPHVRSVASPYGPLGARQISKDGAVAFATVTFDQQTQELPKAAVQRVIDTAQAASDADLKVALAGPDIENAQADRGSSSTLLGVVLALIVLVVAFGALFAALLPLITALVAIGVGYSITGLLSHVMPVATFSTILGVLIGLGVGVDYALFIVSRHRTGLKGGRSVEEAAVTAIDTSGRAVLFAGITVCIALLGQFALGMSFLYGVAFSAASTVALTMLASLTLLPALLGFWGTKVLSRRQRAQLAASGPVAEEVGGFWRRWAEGIERRPVLPAVVALVIVAGLALPFLSLRLGLDDAGTDQPGTTTRQAYDMLSSGFGPGFSGPFLLVAQLPTPHDDASFATLASSLAHEPGVAAVTQPVVSPKGSVAIADLYPSTTPQSTQTADLLDHLRTDVIPRGEAGTGLKVLVGGTTAIQTDFSRVLSSKLPLFVTVVVVLAFLLLMAVFRSLLIPAIASVMNLLSIGAALGIMNAVFSWGWGHSLIGVSRTAPIEVFIPVLMFSILFGLSMDYEVFLVSRMHEEWLATHDNRLAVTTGQAETGRVITAAGTIMVLVFASFVFGGNIVIKQFGIGLAAAIVIDAFIIRMALVPAIMHLTGKANWWLPSRLDRMIPRLHVEGAAIEPPAQTQRAPVGSGRK